MRVEGTSLNRADHRGVNRADPEAAMGARDAHQGQTGMHKCVDTSPEARQPQATETSPKGTVVTP
jgi:hypothetical protein